MLSRLLLLCCIAATICCVLSCPSAKKAKKEPEEKTAEQAAPVTTNSEPADTNDSGKNEPEEKTAEQAAPVTTNSGPADKGGSGNTKATVSTPSKQASADTTTGTNSDKDGSTASKDSENKVSKSEGPANQGSGTSSVSFSDPAQDARAPEPVPTRVEAPQSLPGTAESRVPGKSGQSSSAPAPSSSGNSVTPSDTGKPVGCFIWPGSGINTETVTSLQLKNVTHRRCAAECIMNRLNPPHKYFVLHDGGCICATELPPNIVKIDISNCQLRCDGNNLQPCGSSRTAMIYNLASRTLGASEQIDDKDDFVKVVPVMPGVGKPVGCFFWPSSELRKVTSLQLKNVTHRRCAAECIMDQLNPPHKYFGLHDGGCICATELPPNIINENISYCQLRCDGNNLQPCGYFSTAIIYNLASRTLGASEQIDDKDDFVKVVPVMPDVDKPVGCFTKYVLSKVFTLKNMTHRKCAAKCVGQSLDPPFKYFGIGNGTSCACTMEPPPQQLAFKISSCQIRCDGNNMQPCGDFNFYIFYNLASRTLGDSEQIDDKDDFVKVVPVMPGVDEAVGCYLNTATKKIVLTDKKMTHQKCAAECVRRQLSPPFTYFALTERNSCVCTMELPSKENETKNLSCQIRCPGNYSQPCGGTGAAIFYRLNSRRLEPPYLTDNGQSTAALYFDAVVANDSAKCFEPHSSELFDVRNIQAKDEHKYMSHKRCAIACMKKSFHPEFRYIALRNGTSCMCAYNLPDEKLSSDLTNCQVRCSGYSLEPCGGVHYTLFYKMSTTPSAEEPTEYSMPFAATTAVLEHYPEPLGCYDSSHVSSSFAYAGILTAPSLQACANECIRRSLYPEYQYFGITNKESCFCGLKLPVEKKDAIDCLLGCKIFEPNNLPGEIKKCGGSLATSVYKLEVWTRKKGD